MSKDPPRLKLLASILKTNNQDNQFLQAMAAGKKTQKEQLKLKQPQLQNAREKIILQQKQTREIKKTKQRGR